MTAKKKPSGNGDNDLALDLEDLADEHADRFHFSTRPAPFQRPVQKALPREDSPPPKLAKPAPKAASQTVGATGKVRSNYPGEANGQKPRSNQTQANSPQAQAADQMNDVQDPIQTPGSPKHADPNALAAQLGVTIDVLKKIAMRFKDNAVKGRAEGKKGAEKIEGRAGFISFMQTQTAAFATKHNIDDDYLGLIYDALTVA